MPFIEFFRSRKLKFKILLLFSLILIFPLAILMAVSLERISQVARQDFNRNLGYAASLFRGSLEDQLDSLKIRAKTVADFDFYTLAGMGFSASTTVPLMQYELVRSGLDYIAIVENRSTVLIEEGTTPDDGDITDEGDVTDDGAVTDDTIVTQ